LTLIKYTTEAGETENPMDVLQLVSNHLSTTSGEKIMTIAEQLRQEGMQKGIQAGEANVLLRQLETKFGQLSEKDIKRIQALGTKELLDLSVRILTAKTIQEILH
jgi:predicted transposase YdaD